MNWLQRQSDLKRGGAKSQKWSSFASCWWVQNYMRIIMYNMRIIIRQYKDHHMTILRLSNDNQHCWSPIASSWRVHDLLRMQYIHVMLRMIPFDWMKRSISEFDVLHIKYYPIWGKQLQLLTSMDWTQPLQLNYDLILVSERSLDTSVVDFG